jgi:hypothetical protein
MLITARYISSPDIWKHLFKQEGVEYPEGSNYGNLKYKYVSKVFKQRLLNMERRRQLLIRYSCELN